MVLKDDIKGPFLAALAWRLGDSPRGTRKNLAQLLGKDPAQITDIVKGRRPTEEHERRAVANYFKFDYDDFLDVGRSILAGRDPKAAEADWRGLTRDELRERGFITVPFSDNMRLSAGSGGTVIGITDDIDTSTVVIHGPSIGRGSSRNLQAFRVGGDSMEPFIANGGIVVADLSENDPARLRDGRIYVLRWDLQKGECSVKYLRWGERNRSIVIYSPDSTGYQAIVRRLDEIQLVGRVIWAWREFK